MAEASESVQEAILELQQSLEGGEIARILSIGLFSLAIYEYLITIDEEVKYFWTGRWTGSRVLFLLNRYLPLFIMTLSIVCFSIPDPSSEFCKPAIQVAFVLNIVAVGIIQGILVARIWYLFQGSRKVQIGVILCFLVSITTSMVFLYLSAKQLKILSSKKLRHLLPTISNGCRAERPPLFWRVYLPSLVLHTILYILTAVQALRNRRLLKDAPVLKRLLRDGGFFYFVVFASVSLTAIGSFLKNLPKINIPAIYSHFMLTTTSIAMSRVLFSIHSLAAKLGSETAWLLNGLELSRAGWKPGAHEGELIIERDTVWSEGFDEGVGGRNFITSELRVTQIGKYDDRTW